MSLKASLYKQYLVLISHWPADHLRPQLSFPKFLRQRVDREFGIDTTSQPTDAAPTAVNPAIKEAKTFPKFDEAHAARQLNALSSLLEDRYKKLVYPSLYHGSEQSIMGEQYPVTERVLKPKGHPGYYERLLEELDAAPKRSWLQRQLNSWKGWIRMK